MSSKNKSGKSKNLSKIVGASIGLIIGIIILYIIYGGSNSLSVNTLQSSVNPTIAPIQNSNDLQNVEADLDNTDLDVLENELTQLDSESLF